MYPFYKEANWNSQWHKLPWTHKANKCLSQESDLGPPKYDFRTPKSYCVTCRHISIVENKRKYHKIILCPLTGRKENGILTFEEYAT